MLFATAWRKGRHLTTSRAGRREALASTAVNVGFSTIARSVFALTFAAILVARFEPQRSVELFQLLLLQTIFVTFVSGSGYGRAVSASGIGEELTRLLRGYAAFVAVVVVAIVVLVEGALIPRSLIDRFISPDRWKIYALIAGGVATGLNGILQGGIVRQAGPRRVFLPIAGVSLVFSLSLAIFFVWKLNSDALLITYVAYQGAALLAFVIINRSFLVPKLDLTFRGERRSLLSGAADSMGFGGVNTAVLLIFFLFRQLWKEQADPHIAEAAFFAIRISETYLGILFYVAAGSPILERFRHPHIALGTLLVRVAAFSIIGFFALSLLLYGAIGLQYSVSLIVLCLALQVMCDAMRVPGSLATLFELQYGTALSFALVALPATIAAALAALYLTPASALFSFYFFQLLMSVGQICAMLVNRRLQARRHPARSGEAGSL